MVVSYSNFRGFADALRDRVQDSQQAVDDLYPNMQEMGVQNVRSAAAAVASRVPWQQIISGVRKAPRAIKAAPKAAGRGVKAHPKAAVAGLGGGTLAGMNIGRRRQDAGQADDAPRPLSPSARGGPTAGPRAFEDIVGPPPSQQGGDPFSEAAGLIQQYQQEAGQVAAGYDAQLAELRQMYRFAETPEEQAQLQFMLGDLEAQRDAATQVIDNVYGAAIEATGQRASAMRESAAAEGEAVAGLYQGAADRTGEAYAELEDDYAGTGLAVEGEGMSGDAADWIAVMEAAAPREQALTQRMGDIAAEDVAWLADTLGGEQGAQQGDLQRLVTGLRADGIMSHNARVQDRIAAERMAFANQAAQIGQAGLSAQQSAQERALDLALGLAQERAGVDDRWEAERRQWELDREAQRYAGGEGQMQVPADPQEQMFFVAELMTSNPQAAIAFWNAGLIDDQVAGYFGLPNLAAELDG